MNASIYEFNQASQGYWRNYERVVKWQTRELIWTLIQGNAYIKAEDKPKRISDIMKLSMDETEKIVRVKTPKITEQELKVYQELQFNKK